MRLFLVVILAATLLGPAAASAETGLRVTDLGDDVRVPLGDPADAIGLQASDPLGLLVGVDVLRDHSLGKDVIEVWTCGAPGSPASYADQLDEAVGEYFRHHSRDRYRPEFMARGNAGDKSQDCEQHSRANAGASANGAIHITPSAGGFAGPGAICGFTPCAYSEHYRDGNRRAGFIGAEGGFIVTAAHEMGHMIHWPHSFTGQIPQEQRGEYDNALDLMSGNYGRSGNSYGSYDEPYSTAVINHYAAGWMDPHEVYVFEGGGARLNLATAAGDGFKMAVIEAGNRYFTLAARIPSTHDAIQPLWSGVEVYEVEKCPDNEVECVFESDDMRTGFRRVKPHPAVPFEYANLDAYNEPLPHVIRPGKSRSVNGVAVEVAAISGQRIRVSIGSNPTPIPDPVEVTFSDTTGHVFAADINWLADTGITRGCNPPQNTQFCPNDPVTRGQMAAFLHRALPDLPRGTDTDFVDDNNSVFEADIEWLAATGVTRGCDPPANDRFCPGDVVTRGQMAAFLHRALPDLATSGSTNFDDDNNSVFEADIEWLAATGVTRGCNPPANDHFCPSEPVTRGAMAAFLHRALGG